MLMRASSKLRARACQNMSRTHGRGHSPFSELQPRHCVLTQLDRSLLVLLPVIRHELPAESRSTCKGGGGATCHAFTWERNHGHASPQHVCSKVSDRTSYRESETVPAVVECPL